MKHLIYKVFLLGLLMSVSLAGFAQEITGKVTSKDGEGLPGVTIIVKGTTIGTTTGTDGGYTIKAANGAILSFSYVGFKAQEVTVGAQPTISVTLTEDTELLDEIVVIGYGEVQKRDLTGSVSSIKSSEMQTTTVNSFEQGMQGRISGVQVTGGGAPGAGINVTIRGASSLSQSTQPLYVVDGVPLSNANIASGSDQPGEANFGSYTPTNPLASLNPNDIESVEVLKDASATAIYGSRGANGVVLITTKKGKSEEGTLTFASSVGFTQVRKTYDVLNAREFAEYQNLVAANAGQPLPWGESGTTTPEQVEAIEGQGADWQDAIFRTAVLQDYTLGFGQKFGKGNISVSGSYLDQEGVIIGSRFRRGGLRINLDQELKSWLDVSTNLAVSRSRNDMVVSTANVLEGPGAGIITRAVFQPPFNTFPSDGLIDFGGDNSYQQRYGVRPTAYANDLDFTQDYTRVISGITLKVKLPLGFSFSTQLGINYIDRQDNTFYPFTIQPGMDTRGLSYVFESEFTNLVFQNLLNYKKEFDESNRLNVTLGASSEANRSSWQNTQNSNFPVDVLGVTDLNSGISDNVTNNISEWTLSSFFGRVNYTLNNKYLFTLTARADGSSKFAENEKWGFFPAAAVAWVASEESFIKNLGVFDNLKVRASYGISGNTSIAPYQSQKRIESGGVSFNGILTQGYFFANPGNPALTWETSRQFNAGFDASFWEGRVRSNFDYYIKQTDDLLQNATLAHNTGFENILTNIGSIQNRGFEVTVDVDVISSNSDDDDGFNWTTGINFSRNRNEITDLGSVEEQFSGRLGAGGALEGSPLIQKPGLALGSVWGYVEDGIFQSQEEVDNYMNSEGEAIQEDATVGQIRYKDLNGDGAITTEDRTKVGDTNPDFYAAWNNTLSYKRFSLGILVTTVQGNDILNTYQFAFQRPDGSKNISREVYQNSWSPENTSGTVPQATSNPGTQQRFSSRFLEDGSYIRLKNVRLGYRIPVENHAWISSAQVYVNAINLITITDYSGFDPEVSSFSNDPSRQGVDLGAYPQGRTITMGVNLTF